MIRVSINVNNAAAILGTGAYGAGALLRLERAPSEVGAYTEFDTEPLVAGVDQYTIWDDDGDSTSWYRSRISNSPGTEFSAYSVAFRANALRAYATVDDLLETLPQTSSERNLNVLADILERASAMIDVRCGRDFYRHPQVDGTEVRHFRTYKSDRLDVLDGIVSVATAEYATEFGGTYTALGAENTDWYLDHYIPGTTTYLTLRLPSNGSLTRWNEGPRMARLTGVFGFEEVPEVIRGGTLALARTLYGRIPTGAGGPIGEYDVPSTMLPTEAYIAVEWGAHLGRSMFV